MIDFSKASLSTLIAKGGYDCDCGHHHEMPMDFLCIRPGAVETIPEALKAVGGSKPFIVCDVNTKAAAWSFVEPVLAKAGIEYKMYCFPIAFHICCVLFQAFYHLCQCLKAYCKPM